MSWLRVDVATSGASYHPRRGTRRHTNQAAERKKVALLTHFKAGRATRVQHASSTGSGSSASIRRNIGCVGRKLERVLAEVEERTVKDKRLLRVEDYKARHLLHEQGGERRDMARRHAVARVIGTGVPIAFPARWRSLICGSTSHTPTRTPATCETWRGCHSSSGSTRSVRQLARRCAVLQGVSRSRQGRRRHP